MTAITLSFFFFACGMFIIACAVVAVILYWLRYLYDNGWWLDFSMDPGKWAIVLAIIWGACWILSAVFASTGGS